MRIASPEYGGAFHAEANTQLRFVLPGELVEPDPLIILEPSTSRIAARCPHFGVCGGCDYQHADYPKQIQIKLEILRGVLVSAGVISIPEIKVDSAEPWEYRNRIRLRIQTDGTAIRFGYNQRGGREFLPIVVCPISSPLLLRAAEALVALDTPWLASIAEVEFFASATALQMSVFTRDGRTEEFARFCESMQAVIPELTGAGVMAVTAGFGAKERAAWGSAGLVQNVFERSYWVTRGAFFQVNRWLIERMVDHVTTARTGDLAWDLYAGVGLFSRVLAESFETVIGVEAGEPAASDLAVKPRKGKQIQAVKMETVEFLRRAIPQRERPQFIVMDPPRAGLGADVCELLALIAAPALAYVSCDPTTLARDLKMLVDSGYRIDRIHLVDMFPQTFHLETVVFLSR